MAFPVNIDKTSPPQSETPQLGAGHLRTIRTNLEDLLNLPDATNISFSVVTPTCGQLTWVSTTSIKFAPLNGAIVKIAGTLYLIPSAGVTAANTAVYVNGVAAQNLAASTVYLVTLFNNAGTLTMDFLTTVTHAVDTVAGNQGVEIKTGDNTRSVIGLIRTNSSSQFVDGAQLFVLSWFNRQAKSVVTPYGVGNLTTNSTPAFAEMSGNLRAEFLVWANELAHCYTAGGVQIDTSGPAAEIGLGFDGTTAEDGAYVYHSNATAGNISPYHARVDKSGLAEGYHYVTVLGRVSGASTLTMVMENNAAGRRLAIGAWVMG